METNNSEPTETDTHQIEFAIVRGETSGLVRLDGNQAILSEDTSFEQWKEGLKIIKWIKKKADFAVSHYINFGVRKWGREMVNTALEQLELEATLVKAAIAINAIPQEFRFENLNGDHYVELSRAELTREQAIRWVRIAHEQSLTPMQLRFSIAEGEVVDQTSAKQQGTGVYTVHGIRQSFDIWARRVGGIEGVQGMDMDHKIEIMEELEAICEFGLALHHHILQEQNKAEAANATEPHIA